MSTNGWLKLSNHNLNSTFNDYQTRVLEPNISKKCQAIELANHNLNLTCKDYETRVLKLTRRIDVCGGSKEHILERLG